MGLLIELILGANRLINGIQALITGHFLLRQKHPLGPSLPQEIFFTSLVLVHDRKQPLAYHVELLGVGVQEALGVQARAHIFNLLPRL